MPVDPSCSAAVNTEVTSTYTLTKRVQAGLAGFPQAVRMQATVLVPQAWAVVQTEGPTGYMTQEFATFYTVSLATGALTRRPSTACDPTKACAWAYADPPVFATASGSHAMGAFSKHAPEGQYVQFNFNLGNDANNTTKWTMPFVSRNVAAGTTLAFDAYLCVGTLTDVARCMVALAASLA